MAEFIMLRDVRCSFPHLFTRPIINGDESKCGAQLMLEPDRHKAALAELSAEMKAIASDTLKGRMPPSDKLCLRKGEDRGRAEYDGYIVLSANTRDKPIVIAGDGRSVIQEEKDSQIYAGCYVNAKVRLWGQDNKHGKRINGELISIQFARDGEPLDASYVAVDEAVAGFDPVEGHDTGTMAANDADVAEADGDLDFLNAG